MFYLRLAGTIGGFVIASIYGMFIALTRRDKTFVARDYAIVLSRFMRPPLGMRVEVENRDRIVGARPCIYVSNHQSMYDVPVLADLFQPETFLIGKRELKNIPFFGWMYGVTGNIFIDRSDSASAVAQLKEAAKSVVSRGCSIWIFPEGTRGTGFGELLPFKKGAFHMAVAAGVPILPIVVEPSRYFFDADDRRIRTGTVRVRVLEPIHCDGCSEADVQPLLEKTQARMQEALTELGRMRGSAGPSGASVSPPAE